MLSKCSLTVHCLNKVKLFKFCFVVFFRKRFDFTNYIRCLADNVWDDVDDEEPSEDGEAMEIDMLKLKRPGRNYRNQVSVPKLSNDLETDHMQQQQLILVIANNHHPCLFFMLSWFVILSVSQHSSLLIYLFL